MTAIPSYVATAASAVRLGRSPAEKLYSPVGRSLFTTMFAEALRSRLKVLEDEILHLTMLASQSSEPTEQDNYLHLALDLQREARELRRGIRFEEGEVVCPNNALPCAP